MRVPKVLVSYVCSSTQSSPQCGWRSKHDLIFMPSHIACCFAGQTRQMCTCVDVLVLAVHAHAGMAAWSCSLSTALLFAHHHHTPTTWHLASALCPRMPPRPLILHMLLRLRAPMHHTTPPQTPALSSCPRADSVHPIQPSTAPALVSHARSYKRTGHPTQAVHR